MDRQQPTVITDTGAVVFNETFREVGNAMLLIIGLPIVFVRYATIDILR